MSADKKYHDTWPSIQAEIAQLRKQIAELREAVWVRAGNVNEPGWWFWFSDPESWICPVSVMHSPTTDTYFATEGQLGWNRSQEVIDMGGMWMKIIEPDAPVQP